MSRAVSATLLVLLLAACEEGEVRPEDTDGTGPITCEDAIEDVSLTFDGVVRRANGDVAVGATVTLQDVVARPVLDFGTATTDNAGRYTLVATGITWWPDCSALFTDYELIATLDNAEGTRDVNFQIFTALENDAQRVDLMERPVTLDR